MKISAAIHALLKAVLLSLLSLIAYSQTKEVHGVVTYLAGGSVYTSLGRNDGVQDSMILVVRQKNDTVATLKIFAVSSRSSVCMVLQTKRPLHIGDSVKGNLPLTVSEDKRVQAQKDSAMGTDSAVFLTERKIQAQPSTSFFSFIGRVSLQYYTTIVSQTDLITTQPGIVLNLRGKMNQVPLKFDFYGNLRSTILGGQSPFSHPERSTARVYKFSVDYEDSLIGLSLGRVIPQYAPSVGYIDGAVVSRRFSNLLVGLTAGYQPDYSERIFAPDYKKLSLFMNYQEAGTAHTNFSLAYSRVYYQTLLDREMVSVSLYGALTEQLSLSSQAEVSLRSKSGSELTLSPYVTTLFSNVNYRPTGLFSISVGYNAWSPLYSYSVIQSVPDSLLDRSIRGSLTATVNVTLLNGISIYNTFSPRSSIEGFGKEFSNYFSVAWPNMFNQGILSRLSYSLNSTVATKTNGVGIFFQKTYSRLADVTLRYQFYRHSLAYGGSSPQNSYTIGAEVTAFLLEKLSLWGSVERANSFGLTSYTYTAELSWRF